MGVNSSTSSGVAFLWLLLLQTPTGLGGGLLSRFAPKIHHAVPSMGSRVEVLSSCRAVLHAWLTFNRGCSRVGCPKVVRNSDANTISLRLRFNIWQRPPQVIAGGVEIFELFLLRNVKNEFWYFTASLASVHFGAGTAELRTFEAEMLCITQEDR